MINIGKLKKIKTNFPVLVAEKAIPKNICKNLISEISSSKSFDDIIMGEINSKPRASKKIKSKTPICVPKTFNRPAFTPYLREFVIIKLTVGPGTITTKKLAIIKYNNSIKRKINY